MKPQAFAAALTLAALTACGNTTITQTPTTALTITTPNVHDTEAAIAVELGNLPTTTTTQPPAPVPQYRNTPQPVTASPDIWDRLAQCESGGNWQTNTGNGYGGGLQFAHTTQWSTWRAFGGEQYAPHPWQATREQQIAVAENVLASSGWRAWPGCSRRFGLI